VDAWPAATHAIGIDDAPWFVGVRTEANRIDGARQVVAALPERVAERIHRAFHADEDVIESPQRRQPVLVKREAGGPQFVHPADARPAVVLPVVDRIDVQEVPVRRAHDDQHVVLAGKLHALHAGIDVRQLPRDVPIHQPAQPLLLPRKARLGVEANQVHLAAVVQHVLRFEEAALERHAAEAARRQQPDAGSPCAAGLAIGDEWCH